MILQDFERETSIWYSDAEDIAYLETFNRSMINDMDQKCKDYPKTHKLVQDIIIDGKVMGKEYILPKKLITVRKPTTRKMTEKQKKAAAERLKKGRESKKQH